MEEYNLSYLEALEKVISIVKRDSEHVQGDAGEFDVKTQVENLMEAYCDIDPDIALAKINAIEKNQKTLLEDVAFIIERHFVLMHQPSRPFNMTDGLRFDHLMCKYQFKQKIAGMNGVNMSPIAYAFPEIEYELKKENPSLCSGLPNEMKKFKNFKREYNVKAIFALLPPNKKYGGFVKAYVHLYIIEKCNKIPEMKMYGKQMFQKHLGILRKMYNSSVYSTEKRQEFFDKLGIDEKDLALWSRLFDQQYPGYKEIHKFFEQVE